MKKGLMLLTLLFSLVLPSCGPNEAELRTEMHSIDRELMVLRNAAYRHQSQMNQAEFAAFIGSFATGYGITSGEGELAGEGVGTVINAASDYGCRQFLSGANQAEANGTAQAPRIDRVEAQMKPAQPNRSLT